MAEERFFSRRELLAVAGAGVAGALATACSTGGADPTHRRAAATEGRLRARIGDRGRGGDVERGVQRLGRGLIYVPSTYDATRAHRLVVMLHGAGGSAHGGLDLLLPLADDAELILLAPQSRERTWDVIVRDFGPDVTSIDRMLAEAFERCAVDPRGVAVGGFSDGASYALSLGLTNGDLFSAILAFSPGFSAARTFRGSPAIFVSHGTRDEVLPIERTSRRVVPGLRRQGYDVVYREFDGPHTLPPPIAAEAVAWLRRKR